MDALDDHVVGEDQRLAADLQHRRVVDQPARRRIGGQRAQRVDEGGFALGRMATFRHASVPDHGKEVSPHLLRHRVEQAVDEAGLARRRKRPWRRRHIR